VSSAGDIKLCHDGVYTWDGKDWVEIVAGADVGADGGAVTLSGKLVLTDPLTVKSPGVVITDPETSGFPTTEIVSDPESADDGAVEDHTRSELLEVLLCGECDMELSAPACGPKHAYLADHPMEHRLTAPLLAQYLELMRFRTGKMCGICSHFDVLVPLATGECTHADVRSDQVLISRAMWEELQIKAAKGVEGS